MCFVYYRELYMCEFSFRQGVGTITCAGARCMQTHWHKSQEDGGGDLNRPDAPPPASDATTKAVSIDAGELNNITKHKAHAHTLFRH